jgi:polyisoprenoid-binding protein YceI
MIVLFAAACQRAPVEAPPAETPATLPSYPPPDAVRFVVDPARSELRILVYRGGPLAEFGHNHVVRAGDLRGDLHLAEDFPRSAFAIEFSPAALEVDPPEARRDEGPDFATELSRQAVEGTRTNMLGARVLDVASFPAITLRSVAIQGPASHPVVTVRVGLHGVPRDLSFPVAIERGEQDLVATGTLLLSTPDFGIPSFTAMGGALKVQEELKIKFRIVALKQ